jgi:hypothetical protein
MQPLYATALCNSVKLPKTICNLLWKRYVTACLVTYPVMQPLMEMVCNRLWKWRLTNSSHRSRSVLGCCNNTVSISGEDWLPTISISGYQMLGAHKSVRRCKTLTTVVYIVNRAVDNKLLPEFSDR